MNEKSKRLLIVALALTLAACGRHKNAEPAPAPAPAQPANTQAVPVPEPPPKVNEPPPVVKKDTAIQKLFSGNFQAKTGQAVSGLASLMKSEDGYAIRLEHLRIDGDMPALDVVLSPQDHVATAADLGNALVLGEVKGATGNMNYALPAGSDPAHFHTVVLLVRGSKQVLATAALGLM